MYLFLTRTLPFIFFCLLFIGCQKDEVEPLSTSFSYQEGAYGTISFSATSNSGYSISEDEFIWEFGDGSIKQGHEYNVTHTYKSNGRYNVSVTLNSKDGRSKKVTNTIEVKSVPNTGQGTIYLAKYVPGNIEVSINGAYTGAITKYYSVSAPICGADGCVTITKPAGVYNVSAKANNGTTWAGTITITNGQCSILGLN